MAVLSDADRATIWAVVQRHWSDQRSSLGALTKADLRAAVNAADDWADANAAAYNTALPQPARGALTAQQKGDLLTLIIRVRGGEVL